MALILLESITNKMTQPPSNSNKIGGIVMIVIGFIAIACLIWKYRRDQPQNQAQDGENSYRNLTSNEL